MPYVTRDHLSSEGEGTSLLYWRQDYLSVVERDHLFCAVDKISLVITDAARVRIRPNIPMATPLLMWDLQANFPKSRC